MRKLYLITGLVLFLSPPSLASDFQSEVNLLKIVFRKLHLDDRDNVALVSKKFYQAERSANGTFIYLAKTPLDVIKKSMFLGYVHHLGVPFAFMIDTELLFKPKMALTILDLEGVSLTDKAYQNLPLRLRQLSLRRLDRKRDILPRLTELRCLYLDQVADETLFDNLRHLTRLHTLSANSTPIKSSQLIPIAPKLEAFSAAESKTLNTLSWLQSATVLQALCMNKTDITTADLAFLPVTLEELSLSHCSQIDDFSSLSRLTNLKELELNGTLVEPRMLQGLTSELDSLSLRDCTRLTSLNFCSNIPHLLSLDIAFTRLEGDEFRHLPKDLSVLKCEGVLGALDFSYFTNLKRLKRLFLINTRFTDIRMLPTTLLELDISYCEGVTGFDKLSCFTNLQHLALGNVSDGFSLINVPAGMQSLQTFGMMLCFPEIAGFYDTLRYYGGTLSEENIRFLALVPNVRNVSFEIKEDHKNFDLIKQIPANIKFLSLYVDQALNRLVEPTIMPRIPETIIDLQIWEWDFDVYREYKPRFPHIQKKHKELMPKLKRLTIMERDD